MVASQYLMMLLNEEQFDPDPDSDPGTYYTDYISRSYIGDSVFVIGYSTVFLPDNIPPSTLFTLR